MHMHVHMRQAVAKQYARTFFWSGCFSSHLVSASFCSTSSRSSSLPIAASNSMPRSAKISLSLGVLFMRMALFFSSVLGPAAELVPSSAARARSSSTGRRIATERGVPTRSAVLVAAGDNRRPKRACLLTNS